MLDPLFSNRNFLSIPDFEKKLLFVASLVGETE
jgi:hypothetical protein